MSVQTCRLPRECPLDEMDRPTHGLARLREALVSRLTERTSPAPRQAFSTKSTL